MAAVTGMAAGVNKARPRIALAKEKDRMSWITGAAVTPFGLFAGRSTLDLMSEAAAGALRSAGLVRADIDGLICGYSTTHPHLMLATVFAEHFGIRPVYAHGIQMGGATGFAMTMLADALVRAGVARNILVVAGENRLSGATRDGAMQTLAQVGHPTGEAGLGANIPAYYGLVASAYMDRFGVSEADLAELAVLMRRNAVRRPGAHLTEPVGAADVLASRPIATPLKLLDCCPVSDGGAAVIVSAAPVGGPEIRIRGAGQAHQHQHISAAASLIDYGAAAAVGRAEQASGCSRHAIDYAAIYDSFTITLTILLEEIGLAARGTAGAMARDGAFDPDGALPLNTHGGLLSYGHCGVGGAMAHLAELFDQMAGRAPTQLARRPSLALLHGDGGVLSSHVSLFVENVR